MRKKRGTIEQPLVDEPMEDGLPEVVRAWILRTLIKLDARRRVIDPDEMGAGVILDALGLEITRGEGPAKTLSLLSKLRAMAANYPEDVSEMPLPSQLAVNIDRVGGLLGLSRAERLVLAFAVLLQTEPVLFETVDLIGSLSTHRIPRVLAVILGLPDQDVREALSAGGTLCRTGLLNVDREHASPLQHKIDALSGGFAERMIILDADPTDLLRDKVFPSQPATLGRDDFPHVSQLAGIARAHLAMALESRRHGTNILLHGAPGVGKTELARVLSAEIGVELFEISSENDDGDPIDGDRRLRAYRAAQWFFAKRKLMFLFDEAEDVFSGDEGFFATRSSAQRRKAWMNRMLEGNPIPTIWVSNRVDCLDPAFVRRFDIVIEVPNPPLAQREAIIRRATCTPLEEPLLERLASCTHLTPAIVTRAAQVSAVDSDGSASSRRSESMALLIDSTLRAQGHPGLAKHNRPGALGHYDVALINADADVAALARQLTRQSSARILLHGPPGTGKTAYARWLAGQMGAPILVKRASDLLSMFVGQAEKNLAEAFSEAERSGAVLLIDEIDSFLQDRRLARASWETTLVNEMLTQMESFPGAFFASTNLDCRLDPASWRRFDMKIGFDYLQPTQTWAMFRQTCEETGLDCMDAGLEQKVRNLRQVTPGDFHTASRHHRLSPLRDANRLYLALLKEQTLKGGVDKRYGFV